MGVIKKIRRQMKKHVIKKKESLLDIFNTELYFMSLEETHRHYLHPTKGFKKINKKREDILGLGLKQRASLINKILIAIGGGNEKSKGS